MIYTSLGLQRVKPYVQFGGGIMWRVICSRRGSRRRDRLLPLRGAPGRLILAGVPWVTSRFPSILVGYNRESLSELVCLVLYSKHLHVLGPHVRSGRVHGQVDGSSGRSGPPVGDG
jgi:hypothetical protein